MSRHRESVELFWSKEEFREEESLINTLSRDRSKDVALDYIQDSERDDLSENLALESSAESKLKRIVNECTKLIGSINYCNAKQEEFKLEGAFSPFLKATIEENKENLVKCLKENCYKDNDTLDYVKTKEPQLFADINQACGNILNDALKA